MSANLHNDCLCFHIETSAIVVGEHPRFIYNKTYDLTWMQKLMRRTRIIVLIILLITAVLAENSSVCLFADGAPRDGRAGHAGPADVLVDDHAGADGRGGAATSPASRLRCHEPCHESPPPRRRSSTRAPRTLRSPCRSPTSWHRHRPSRTRSLCWTIQTTKDQTRGDPSRRR